MDLFSDKHHSFDELICHRVSVDLTFDYRNIDSDVSEMPSAHCYVNIDVPFTINKCFLKKVELHDRIVKDCKNKDDTFPLTPMFFIETNLTEDKLLCYFGKSNHNDTYVNNDIRRCSLKLKNENINGKCKFELHLIPTKSFDYYSVDCKLELVFYPN
jgi:hypothetical protein